MLARRRQQPSRHSVQHDRGPAEDDEAQRDQRFGADDDECDAVEAGREDRAGGSQPPDPRRDGQGALGDEEPDPGGDQQQRRRRWQQCRPQRRGHDGPVEDVPAEERLVDFRQRRDAVERCQLHPPEQQPLADLARHERRQRDPHQQDEMLTTQLERIVDREAGAGDENDTPGNSPAGEPSLARQERESGCYPEGQDREPETARELHRSPYGDVDSLEQDERATHAVRGQHAKVPGCVSPSRSTVTSSGCRAQSRSGRKRPVSTARSTGGNRSTRSCRVRPAAFVPV